MGFSPTRWIHAPGKPRRAIYEGLDASDLSMLACGFCFRPFVVGDTLASAKRGPWYDGYMEDDWCLVHEGCADAKDERASRTITEARAMGYVYPPRICRNCGIDIDLLRTSSGISCPRCSPGKD